MTEMTVGPASALLAFDLWDAHGALPALGCDLPPPGRATTGPVGTVLRIGPKRWWLHGTGFAAHEIGAALQEAGVVTPVEGGWVRVELSGAQWRDLVMQSGLIDAEAPSFGPGSVAVTQLNHARCVMHVRANTLCDIYVPASYADHCLSAWRDMGWNQIGR